MRQEPAFFEAEEELTLVFMARRLPDALKLEGLLNDAGIDYLIETGTYSGGLLFRRELTGAFFYVTPTDSDRAKAVLIANRLKPYRDEGGG